MADDPHPPDAPPLFRFQGRRSVVHSTRGIVACTSPLAGQAGLQILQAGGNAADAAVAVAAVLGVVDPSMTGIGGDVFSLFYDATTGAVKGLNASGRTPKDATREVVCREVGVAVSDDGRVDEAAATSTTIPSLSIHTITVPGAAAGWVDAVEQFGSGKLTLAQILDPAIRLAENGFPVGRLSAYYWAMTEEDLRTRSPENAGHELLKADPSAADRSGRYRAPREGEIFCCPELAATLRRLAEHGKAGFYEGPVAEAMVAVSQAKGGLLSLADLKHHADQPPDIAEALSIAVGSGGVRLWEHPPNGQGIVALLAAGILQELERTGKIPPLATMEHNSAAYLHAVITALRIAFADASWHVADPADPAAGAADPRRLLDPAYLAKRATLFDASRVPGVLEHGIPTDSSCNGYVGDVGTTPDSRTLIASVPTSDTVYLAVTDDAGNGCSFVNSVSDRFGSCIVPKGTGFALQNRGRMFRLGPAGHPNVYAGGKRAYNTIIPAILTQDVSPASSGEPGTLPQPHCQPHRQLRAVFGVMGGLMQPQGHLQVLLNMQAFGFDPQTALDAPRVCIGADLFATPPLPAGPSAPLSRSQIVYVEEGVPADAIHELRERGHHVRCLSGYARSLFGRGQVIQVEHDPLTGQRVYAAGSDPRGDGHAVPLL